MQEQNPCEHCFHQGFIKCQECNGGTMFGRNGECKKCEDSGVEECPVCKNPEEYR